jgi:hypothetical protein
MKKLTPHLIIFFVGLIITYISFAFVQGTFNTFAWGESVRFGFIAFFFLINGAIQLIYSVNKYNF